MIGMARRLFNGVKWSMAGLVCILLLLLFIQLIGLSGAVSDSSVLDRTDLVVVFSGATERDHAGIQIANTLEPDYFTIAGYPYGKFQSVTNNKILPSITPIFIRQSTSTFEDAVITRDLIKEYGIQSVTLVTSGYHMLRARFALHLMLAGQGVHIQTYSVPYKNCYGLSLLTLRSGRHYIFNEMVKLPGTIVEFIIYAVATLFAFELLNLEQKMPIAYLILIFALVISMKKGEGSLKYLPILIVRYTQAWLPGHMALQRLDSRGE